jgi:ABC-2 type transport system permease protein
MVLRVVRRPLAELPNLIISAFFLFVYDGALGGVFGGAASGTPFDFAKGNFINFILPVSIVSASLSGAASGIYLVEDIESGVFKRYQSMPISRWAIILAPMNVGALRVLVQSGSYIIYWDNNWCRSRSRQYWIFDSSINCFYLGNGICWIFSSSRS